jgi:hypothetical protein
MHTKFSMTGWLYRRPKLKRTDRSSKLALRDFFLPPVLTAWRRCLDHNSSRSFDYAGNRDFDFRN